jgi:superfamily II DNA/RNA helicase
VLLGRGGEVQNPDRTWRTISRDEAKRRFRHGEANVLLCTDAAAEGLNFQLCGALINYDMPWNPIRVEQWIGRLGRLGQKHEIIRTFNLHHADTVETDVCRALRERINLFESVVGKKLQPILARLPTLITNRVLAGRTRPYEERAEAVREIEAETVDVQAHGFDLDAVTEADLAPLLAPARSLGLAK